MKTNNLLTTFVLVAVLSLSLIGCKNKASNNLGSTEKVLELTAVEAEEFILEWAGVVTATDKWGESSTEPVAFYLLDDAVPVIIFYID